MADRLTEATPPYDARPGYLLDTSVLVAGLVALHPEHPASHRWLARAVAREIRLVISRHSLAECYAALTRLPIKPPLDTHDVLTLIEKSILDACQATTIVLEDATYRSVLARCARAGHRGGIIHDAIIGQCALVAGVPLVTANIRHFQRLFPDGNLAIIPPS